MNEEPTSNIYQTKASWGSQQKISGSGVSGTQSSGGIQPAYSSNIMGGVQGLGSGYQTLGSGVQSFGSGVQSLGSGIQNLSSSIHR